MNTEKMTNSFVCGLVVVASLVVGCGAPAAQMPAPDAAMNAPKVEAPAVKQAKATPKSATECKALAQTTPPNVSAASGTDVQKQFGDAFDAYHETFRCCFDGVYAPHAPRMNGQVALDLKVDHEGKLVSAEVIASETNIMMPEMHACMLDVAKALVYPRPANDMALGYKRVFGFKARR